MLRRCHQAAVQQFPPLPNALALTSPRIQVHLAAQGKPLPLVGEALSQLAEQGCRRVVVNSLLLAEGAEWDTLRSQVEQRRADFDQLILIPPLLTSRSQTCAQTLDALFPAEPGLTRVLLGHGCAQGENSAYAALQAQLKSADAMICRSRCCVADQANDCWKNGIKAGAAVELIF
ncbi:MAG: sirohydrochlorin cobaltochelatase [Holdemania filiformis]